MSELVPVNASMLDHAMRHLRHALEAASRGDEKAQRAILQAAAAPVLASNLNELALWADACAPTLDELKINRGLYSQDQHQLRYATDRAQDALSQAAGRAVVVELSQSCIECGARRERAQTEGDAA